MEKNNIVYYEFLDFKVIPTEEKFMKTVHDTQLALLNTLINESYEFDILTKMDNVNYLKDGYYLLKQKEVLESESLIFFHKLLERYGCLAEVLPTYGPL